VLMQIFHGLAEPWNVLASHVVAGTIAFAAITFLHIVLGELAPKSVALLFPERTSLATAAPLIWFSRLTAPFIAVLNGTANLLLRVFGLRAPTEMERVHHPDEIQLIVRQMHAHKQIGAEPAHMIRGVFHLSERTAADIMTPRTRIVAISDLETVTEAADQIVTTGYSRLPVYHDSVDRIVGVVLALDVWRARQKGVDQLREIIRPVPYVPDTKPLEDLLTEMRRDNVHLVVVLDEFGGTHGIVTMEDLVEEVMGDIQDEDEPSSGRIQLKSEGVYAVAGDVAVEDLNDRLGLDLPIEDVATVGGLLMTKLGRVPQEGDVVRFRGITITISSMEERRVALVELRREAGSPSNGMDST
jgi:CBS domain containing-hemolysin-like protein